MDVTSRLPFSGS